ncbi:hypothetical protein GPECTOR_32g528 [Gonium pectorale]|uniref:NYN domain-containing protein n=1 Tax=Gonium pectorale TaxID=33097 RepID=A0A150GEB2_GONPE|nr:hypothetical protein GPECTOR_32g528 [Gonium pectorale]|eukprot:KXZ47915.1 hypothetical protein GPECTOR_32g528 [Gonium pectorale]
MRNGVGGGPAGAATDCAAISGWDATAPGSGAASDGDGSCDGSDARPASGSGGGSPAAPAAAAAATASDAVDATLPYVLMPGAVSALRDLLAGRRVALLWDLDNVDFFAPAHTAPLQLQRIKALIAAAGAEELALCRAYANTDTARRLAAVLPVLERCGLLAVERVAPRPDAADVAMVQDAVEFGATHGSLGAVLCVSQDSDFASPMRYLSERGIITVAISPQTPRRKASPASRLLRRA